MLLAGILLMSPAQLDAQVCGIASDRTLSGHAAQRQQAIDASITHIGEFLESRGCKGVVTASFIDAGPFTPRKYIDVPEAPAVEDCSRVSPAKVDPQRSALLAFGGYQARLKKTARASCLAEQARTRAAYTRLWADFLRQVRAVIARDQVSVTTRTDIRGLLFSFLGAGIQDVLLITDGVDQQGIGQLPNSARVFIVQYPVRNEFGNGAATDSAAVSWRRAGATVLPYPVLMPGIWKRWKS